MIGPVLVNILRFLVLVALQVFILNRVEISSYLNPNLYVLFILLLPFEVRGAGLLGLAFALGLAVDVFSDTLGMHLMACLFMAWCRPLVLGILSPRGGYEVGAAPGIRDMGLTWFVSYAATLVLLHHLLLFFVEAFGFYEAHLTLARVLGSTVFTLALVVLAQYLTFKPRLSE